MDDETRNSIYAGDFTIFAEVTPRRVEQLCRPLEDWVSDQLQCKKQLEKVTPPGTGQLVPIVMSSVPVTLTIAAVGVAGKQAGLFSQGKGTAIEAGDDAIDRLNVAADISKKSIDVGIAIVEEMERRPLSAEEMQTMISSSPDEKITRNIIEMARSGKLDIDFENGSRQVGGQKNVPSRILSEKTYLLRGCRVLADLGDGMLKLYVQESEDLRRVGLCKHNELRVESDENSMDGKIARFACISKAVFDCYIGVSEKVNNGKRQPVLLSIIEPLPILLEAKENLAALTQDL